MLSQILFSSKKMLTCFALGFRTGLLLCATNELIRHPLFPSLFWETGLENVWTFQDHDTQGLRMARPSDPWRASWAVYGPASQMGNTSFAFHERHPHAWRLTGSFGIQFRFHRAIKCETFLRGVIRLFTYIFAMQFWTIKCDLFGSSTKKYTGLY